MKDKDSIKTSKKNYQSYQVQKRHIQYFRSVLNAIDTSTITILSELKDIISQAIEMYSYEFISFCRYLQRPQELYMIIKSVLSNFFYIIGIGRIISRDPFRFRPYTSNSEALLSKTPFGFQEIEIDE